MDRARAERLTARLRRVAPVLSNDAVAGREPLSALSARHGALAAINGGYFVIGEADGTPGDLAGTSIVDGQLISEAVDGRTDLVLGRRGPSVTALTDRLWVIAPDRAVRELDGLNREPGLIRACGGSGGDAPTEAPLHDITCTDPSELIASRPVLGASTEAGPGVEALLDGFGRVSALREPRGGPVPPGGSAISATGDAAAWLQGPRAPRRAPTGDRRGHQRARPAGPHPRARRGQRRPPARARRPPRHHRQPRRVRPCRQPRLLLRLRAAPQPAHARGRHRRRAAAAGGRRRPRARLLGRPGLRGGGRGDARARRPRRSQPRRRRLDHDDGARPRRHAARDAAGERPIADAILVGTGR